MATPEGIVSIQSWVAYGHVGNAAAVFPLQCLGFDVWPVHTVQFSNHTGYGVWRGQVMTVDHIRDVVEGIGERGALAGCRAVLSGYLGAPELGEAVLDAVRAVRGLRSDALYACDPVMGDDGRGFFVREGIPAFFAEKAVPAADIMTPNRFELEHLTGLPVTDVPSALAATAALRARGPRIVAVTSLPVAGDDGQLAVLADCAEGAWHVRTPRLPVNLNGTGDAFTALLLGHYLQTGRVDRALGAAVATLFGVIEATAQAGVRELRLVASQDGIRHPEARFPVEPVRRA
ncbi:pyridoxal kinase PdxY [Marinivivus vitaminiproducens]|uniref:pyridoxal kinase PdxY n=1 Tax=Marinivivus vitaminiproducens TaxID=3035935 RepID=UPI0027A4B1D2|nr:pyridoxal kinase PdxY [Geminicoccaceae bacterium SCSIO 64248]